MNEKVKGTFHEAKGKVKEMVGKITIILSWKPKARLKR